MIDMQIVRIVEYSIAFITLYFTVFIILLYIKYRNSVSEKPRIDKKFTPRLSVIIPAFNEEDTLEHCVKSLVDADYPKEELDIIIVDDGSKDKSYAIAKLLSNRYKNVRCFTKKNEGKAAALNYAITRADGEIIATLDADSFIEKDTISVVNFGGDGDFP